MKYTSTYSTSYSKIQAKGWKIGNGGMLAIGGTIVLLFLYSTGSLASIGLKPGSSGLSGTTCTTNQGQTYVITQPNYSCGVGLQLSFQTNDPLAGSGLNTPVITIYNGLVSYDTSTGSSVGTGTSALTNYQTGGQYWGKIVLSLYPTLYTPFVVPPIPTSATLPTTVNVPLYDYKTGTWSMSITGTGGTAISTGQVYWWAADTLTSVTLATTITETTNNQGWKSSYDFIDGVMNNLVLEISDGGGANSNSQYLTVTGPEYASKQGVTNYWQYVLPDGVAPQVNVAPGTSPSAAFSQAQTFPTTSLGTYAVSGQAVTSTTTSGPLGSLSGASTSQLVSTTTQGGQIQFNLVVGKGSLTAGNQITLTFKLWENYDANYFAKTGSANPLSGQPTAANIGSAATFTIKFNG